VARKGTKPLRKTRVLSVAFSGILPSRGGRDDQSDHFIKGQIAIPKAVRERLNLGIGTEVSIDVQGEAW